MIQRLNTASELVRWFHVGSNEQSTYDGPDRRRWSRSDPRNGSVLDDQGHLTQAAKDALRPLVEALRRQKPCPRALRRPLPPHLRAT